MASPWGTVTYFVINRDYIKTALCENRNRPALRCDGKCFLAKKLKQQQEAARKDALESVKGFSYSPLYFEELQKFSLLFIPEISGTTGWLAELNFFHNPFPSGVFHPPRSIAQDFRYPVC